MALAEFIVTFREFFEIFLVIGIMAAYLQKSGNSRYLKFVVAGSALAALASVAVAWAFGFAAETFEEHEALFEGVTLVLAAILVTWLILWMFRQRNMAKQVEAGLKQKIDVGEELGVAALAFVAVFREGIEVVLFLNGISLSTGAISAAWALGGALAASALAYLVFKSFIRLDFKTFFLATSAVLVVLAAGLLSQGVHELEEVGVLPPLIEHIYDVTPALNADGTFPLLHEKGAVGGVLKGIVGYDTSPSLLQLLAYFGYLALVYLIYRQISRGHAK
jgi:high-affinity iron transporter